MVGRRSCSWLEPRSSARRVRSQPRFFSDDPLTREPETQDASGAKSRTSSWRPTCCSTCSRGPATRARRARAQREHHRRGPGLELVHQPHLCAAGHVDEIARGPNARRRRPPGPGRSSGQDQRLVPGFTARDSRGVLVRAVRRGGHPRAATSAVPVATRLFWALGYHQVESHLVHSAPRTCTSTRGDDRDAGRPSPPLAPRRRRRRAGAGSARRGRLVPRAGGLAVPGRSSARSSTTARGPTTPTTSCRTSTGASCGR